MNLRKSLVFGLGLIVMCLTCGVTIAQINTVNADQLASEFSNPPMSARPFTWWHWVNGAITKEGITQDLEWMKRFGLGGAVVFNVGMLGDDVPRKVPFESDQWWQMVDHAIREADRLGLKLGFHNCDGWSHSGGPWITPQQSMKKLVWTETYVQGGQSNIQLEQPETIRDYYCDVAILAFPVNDRSACLQCDRLSSNLPKFQPQILLDDNPKTAVPLRNIRPSQPVYFDFMFNTPQAIASLTLKTTGDRIKGVSLSVDVSRDGQVYQKVDEFRSQLRGILGWKVRPGGSSISFSFPQQTTKYFRITFTECSTFHLTDIQLHETERLDLWEIKAGHLQYTEHGGAPEMYRSNLTDDSPNSRIPRESILDLSDKLGQDNRLNWSVPNGRWRIVRIGYTTTGKTNSPSTVEGRGLEADKLDTAALDTHYDNFMHTLKKRPVNQKTSSLAFTEIDSWEAGVQDWTGKMPDVFRELNGYDIKPFLPVLTGGYIIDDAEVSERFLWDFRKTVAYLIRNGCFQHLASLAEKDGLTAFSEGSGRQQYLYDPINYQSAAPIPKGEFWIGRDAGANLTPNSALPMRPRIDCKVAASVAHIYGGQLAASESFTGGRMSWEYGPYDNKMLGDLAFTMGVNWIVLHTSAHQPYSEWKPGFSLGGAGSHFHRNNIVYAQSDAWSQYLTRCQYLLRKGLFVADVLCFTGEDVPNYLGFRDELSVSLLEGYDYDGCNAEILLKQSRVEHGRIVLDSGMSYRVLLLPDQGSMSPALAQRIRDMVQQGATVVGPKPKYAPGLRGYPQADQQVRKIADDVWGPCDGVKTKENRYGKGRVIWGKSFEQIFTDFNLCPDFTFQASQEDAYIHYIHRRMDSADIYFVANARPHAVSIRAGFRVKDKVPYLYRPDTGQIIPTAAFQQYDEYIEVPLQLDPSGSVFVVFWPGQKTTSIQQVNGPQLPELMYAGEGQIQAEFFTPGSYELIPSAGKPLDINVMSAKPIVLDGLWDIRFADRNEKKTLKSGLFAWNTSDDPMIRYYSGTAVYRRTFNLPAEFKSKKHKVYIDLGDVQKIARVSINGKQCPDIWKAPFRTEITEMVSPGDNQIEIAVTNTWSNRMIGDEQFPEDIKYKAGKLSQWPEWMEGDVSRSTPRQTFTISNFYKKNDRLIPSGLLGPVTIQATDTMTVRINR